MIFDNFLFCLCSWLSIFLFLFSTTFHLKCTWSARTPKIKVNKQKCSAFDYLQLDGNLAQRIGDYKMNFTILKKLNMAWLVCVEVGPTDQT